MASNRPNRNLLRTVCKKGLCDTVVTLQWSHETPNEIGNMCEQLLVLWVWFPIKAVNYTLVSDPSKFEKISKNLLELRTLLSEGKKLLIHCAAGVHRTGFVTYVLLRLCGRGHDEAINLIQIIRPVILEKISRLRLEIAETFYEKIVNGAERYVPCIDTLGMSETDWIKQALNPLIFIKVGFFQDIARVSFCVISSDFQKIIGGTELFMRNNAEFAWRELRSIEDVHGVEIRTAQECEEIVHGLIMSSTHVRTTKIAGTSCFLDKEFMYRYMPKVIEVLHYRIVDLATFSEIKNSHVQQTLSIYDDIRKYIELESHLRHSFNKR